MAISAAENEDDEDVGHKSAEELSAADDVSAADDEASQSDVASVADETSQAGEVSAGEGSPSLFSHPCK